jgi:predicted double-glycine peptidase
MPGLPVTLNVLLCLVTAGFGVWMGRRAHRREALSDATHVLRHSPHLWLVLGLPLGLLAYHLFFVIKPEWEWRLPYPVQYYYGPVAWGVLIGCFTYFAGFGGAVYLETRHRQRLQLGALVGLLLVAVQLLHARSTKRDAPVIREAKTTFEGFVYQTSPETCVPAAAASLLATLGDRRTESELVELMGTDRGGTLPAQLVMALRRMGFRESTFSVDRGGLAAVAAPSVVFLRNNLHAVTLLRHDHRGALIWDPGRGRVFVPAARFEAFMAGAHAIAFSRVQPVEAPPRAAALGGI